MPEKVPFRNPYPIPDVSSEGAWKRGPVLGKKVTVTDRRWKTKVDTHERLFAHHTLNSIRNDQRLVRKKAPNDALDFALASVYTHSEDTFVPKMYVSMQPETLRMETWRVLRNELKTETPEFGIPTIPEDVEDSSSSSPEASKHEKSERKRGHPNKKALPNVKTAARAKLAARAKAAASGGKTGPGSKAPGGSHRAVGSKGRTGPKGGAATGPKKPTEYSMSMTRPTSTALRMRQGAQLHQYAGGGQHGIPDRMERIHPSTLKLAIDGPHSDQTKSGYSRKENGTFYGI
ncbi:uncharacterized protein [Venturia canescens]|uniref:uncharacterized protein n=1 Tax=Venturia canescens TaxID=32260 RepID=UPI001C9C26A2|nr:uncharacterized protein LOC122406021 [Venturia canescens]